MDPLNEEEIEEEIRNTIKGLADKEYKNTTPFKHWPRNHIQGTPYELEPKRHNSDLEGAATRS